MTIRLGKKSWLEKILNRFGYHRQIQLPNNSQELRDRFGPYVSFRAKSGSIDFADCDILAELSILADKMVTIAAAIRGLDKLNDNDRDAAIYGLARMVIELSNQVSEIHAAYEKKEWAREEK